MASALGLNICDRKKGNRLSNWTQVFVTEKKAVGFSIGAKYLDEKKGDWLSNCTLVFVMKKKAIGPIIGL